MNDGIVVNGRACKVTIPLELAALPPVKLLHRRRTALRIRLPGGTMFAEVATKSLRRAVAAIAEHGADAVVVFVEGKLSPGNIVQGAGLITRPKAAATQAGVTQTEPAALAAM